MKTSEPAPAAVMLSSRDPAARFGRPESAWRLRAYTIVFESDTAAGRLFDLVLIVAIFASVAVVILDSVQSISARHGTLFDALEWGFTLLFTVTVLGTLMYVVEGPANGFTSIPVAIYWGITTLTTVGFGDITPKTDLGRFIASCMMLMGWGILAVPTGIVTAEMTVRRFAHPLPTRECPDCGADGLDANARFCQHCGKPLPALASSATEA